jgi:hypothetical protein
MRCTLCRHGFKFHIKKLAFFQLTQPWTKCLHGVSEYRLANAFVNVIHKIEQIMSDLVNAGPQSE